MEEFDLRRERLLDSLEDNSVAIIYSGVSKIRSEDDLYPFHANRHFFYLTGIEQENSILVLLKSFGERKEFLFLDEYNEVKERWTGKRLTFELASDISKIDNVYSNANLDNMLDMMLTSDSPSYGKIDNLYLDLSDEIKVRTNCSTQLLKEEFQEKYPHLNIKNVYSLITNLRMVKSQLEVNNLIEAINCTNLGINDLLVNLHIGMSEHELSDRFEYYGKLHGRRKLAFETICAAGKDATIMHHPISQQEKIIEEGELVLFDLGYRYNGYSADISRTYPVNGVFSDEQKKIYQAVLTCNKEIIDYVKPGLCIKDLQEKAIEILKREAVKAGLVKEDEDIKKYYIHNVSHHLGLDTHDVGGRETILVPGNVITVEPGLYFVEKGVGVRIEDDVLVTENGSECLSKGIKKEISDIEKMLSKRKGF